jgi:hypothetical protein
MAIKKQIDSNRRNSQKSKEKSSPHPAESVRFWDSVRFAKTVKHRPFNQIAGQYCRFQRNLKDRNSILIAMTTPVSARSRKSTSRNPQHLHAGPGELKPAC